jgi:hypothetical protein
MVRIAYDIAPECVTGRTIIKKADFLTEKISYKHGRLVIGNPPYGVHLSMAQKFYKKAIEIGDYIAFILPISQLQNTKMLYEFDLIASVDLGKRKYTDRMLHCCFNIYRRPISGKNNERQVSKLKDITIYRQDSKDYACKAYDIRMCYWGNGCCGKILKDDEHYAAEYKIQIHNDVLRGQIKEVIEQFNWQGYAKGIAMKKLQQYYIINILKQYIPNIQ